MLERARIGLVGTGRMALRHITALHESSLSKSIDVPVVVSKRHGPLPTQLASNLLGAAVVQNLEDAMCVGTLDGVIIAASSNNQATVLLDALELRIPNIFIEKPMAMTVSEAEAVEKALGVAEAAGNFPFVQIGFHRRYDYCFSGLRRDILRNLVPDTKDNSTAVNVRSIHLISYDAHPPADQADLTGASPRFAEEAGSLFIDFSTHDFDMLRWLTSDDFDVQTVMHDKVEETGEEESVIVLRGRRTGCRAVIENSRSCGYGHDQRAHVLLSNGVELRTEGHPAYMPNGIYPDFLARYEKAYLEQMDLFARAACHARCVAESLRSEEVTTENSRRGHLIGLPTISDATASLQLAFQCERILQGKF